MNRSYITVQDIKDSLGLTASTDDKLLLKMAESAAKMVENYTGRKFNVETATKYYEGANRVWFDDLLTVSTIKLDEDANASFEATLTTSDYVLYPLNNYPKTYMEIADTSNYGSFAYGVKKGVEIVGTWGYAESSSPVLAWAKTASAVPVSASLLTVLIDNLEIGQTCLIDNEQYYVTEVSGSIANVIPAQNGTSATTHTASTMIYSYQYPADIWQACMNLVSEEYQNRTKKGITSEGIGDYRYSLDKGSINSIMTDALGSFSYYRSVKF